MGHGRADDDEDGKRALSQSPAQEFEEQLAKQEPGEQTTSALDSLSRG